MIRNREKLKKKKKEEEKARGRGEASQLLKLESRILSEQCGLWLTSWPHTSERVYRMVLSTVVPSHGVE
jgi:hypothetical protein